MPNVVYTFDTAPAVFGINPTGFTQEISPVGFWHYRVWHSQNDGNPYVGVPANKYRRFDLRARIAFTAGQYDPDQTFFGFMTSIPPDNVALANVGPGYGFFHYGQNGTQLLAPGWFYNGTWGYSFSTPGQFINWAPYNNNGYRDLTIEVQADKSIKLSVEGLTAVSPVPTFNLTAIDWTHIVGGPINTGVGGTTDGNYWFDMSADTLTLVDPNLSPWDKDRGSYSPMVMG